MKPWEKPKSGKGWDKTRSDFNEYYTTYEQCEQVLGSLKKLGFLDKFKKICCPCDGDQSNIVKWLQNNTNAEIVHFNYLDCNSQKARQIMMRCGCVITNQPFAMKSWKPLFWFLHNSQIPYFIWGPLPTSRDEFRYHLDYIFSVKCNSEYLRPNGELVFVGITTFYTNFDVPYPDYEYEPAKEDQWYRGLPMYDKVRNVPKNYYGWFYAPFSILFYLKHYDINRERSGDRDHGKYVRLCVRRRKEDGDT